MAQQVAQAISVFQEQRTGCLPQAMTVVLSEDTLVVTLHEALSPAEKALASTPESAAQVQEFHGGSAMLVLSKKDRESAVVGGADVASTLSAEPIHSSMAPAASSELVAAEKLDGTDLPSTGLVVLIRHRLQHHPRFRGRASLFAITLVGETIVVTGRLPSHHLKQLLQQAIRVIPGVVRIQYVTIARWEDYRLP